MIPNYLARRLAREGHHVVEAKNGRSALERIAAETFDLILLEMIMPDINGYEVLTQLKADARFRRLNTMADWARLHVTTHTLLEQKR